jgi:hypothetical protein
MSVPDEGTQAQGRGGAGRGRRRGRPTLLESLRREASAAQGPLAGALALPPPAEDAQLVPFQGRPGTEVALPTTATVPSTIIASLANPLPVASEHPLAKYVILAAAGARSPGVQLNSEFSKFAHRFWHDARAIGSAASLVEEAARVGKSRYWVQTTMRRLGAAAELAERHSGAQLQAHTCHLFSS